MITLDVQTWASIATIIATGIAVLTMLSRKIDKVETGLGDRIDRVETGLGDRIEAARTEARNENAQLRNDMSSGFAAVGHRLGVLEQRTYDLSARLPPAPANTGGD